MKDFDPLQMLTSIFIICICMWASKRVLVRKLFCLVSNVKCCVELKLQ